MFVALDLRQLDPIGRDRRKGVDAGDLQFSLSYVGMRSESVSLMVAPGGSCFEKPVSEGGRLFWVYEVDEDD